MEATGRTTASRLLPAVLDGQHRALVVAVEHQLVEVDPGLQRVAVDGQQDVAGLDRAFVEGRAEGDDLADDQAVAGLIGLAVEPQAQVADARAGGVARLMPELRGG